MKAAQSQAQGGPSALAELCRIYWYPLYIFARRRGHSPDDAQDLTQAFFLHLLEHRAFSSVDRLKGKFRSFLLASFQNHLSDQIDRTRRLKRGGDKEFVPLYAEEAEERSLTGSSPPSLPLSRTRSSCNRRRRPRRLENYELVTGEDGKPVYGTI